MYQDEQTKKHIIDRFKGLNESVDESLLEPGETQNMQNFVTYDGVLEVTKGFQKFKPKPVPGGIASLMVYHSHNVFGGTDQILLAASNSNIYRWDDDSSNWVSIKSGLTTGRFDFINFHKGVDDIVIMTNGRDPVLKFDGKNVSNLGGNPPKGTSIGLHYTRVWISGVTNNPDSVHYSAPADPEDWSQELGKGGFILLHTWDGGKCEALTIIYDDVIVFKTYDIWKILGTYQDEYEVTKVYSAVGSIARDTIVDAGNASYFLDQSGIYLYDGTQTKHISAPIDKTIRSINKKHINKSVAVFYDNLYILAVPVGESTENDTIIELNTLTGQYIIKRGFKVTDFLVFGDKLLFSGDSGYVYEYGVGDTFDGKPIVAYWETPSSALGSLSSTKRSTYLYSDVTGGAMKATVIGDSKSASATFDNNPRNRARLKAKGRKLKLRFENVNGSRFVLKSSELHYDADED